MTCIVGLEHDGKVWMGGDAASTDSNGTDQVRHARPKVFTVNRGSGTDAFLIGFTSSFRMGQLLQYSLTPPVCAKHRDPFEYMVNDLADTLRDLFRSKGFLSTGDEGKDQGGDFLIGFRGTLYSIAQDFH